MNRAPSVFRNPFRVLLLAALLGGCAGKGGAPKPDAGSGKPEAQGLPGAGSAARQLTSSAGDQASPAFFPDGSRLVYQNNSDGNWELYELDLATATPKRITDTPENEESPVVSPDGLWLLCTVHPPALEQDPPRNILLVSRDGKTRRLVVDHPADDWLPRFSPDGQFIYFVSDRVESRAEVPDSERKSAIFRVPRDGGQAEQLTEGQDETAVLPLADNGFIYRDPQGHLQKQVADGSRQALYTGTWILGAPSKGSDGRFWIGGSENLDSPCRLLLADSSLSKLEPLDPGMRQEDRGPAVSPDGGSVAFYGRSAGQWDLYLLERPGNR